MKIFNYKNCLTVPILAIVAALSTGAIAGDQAVIELPNGTRSIKVSYANADLRSEAGVEKLNDRIRQAARTVCGVSYSNGWNEFRASRKCLRKSITEASYQVKVAIARVRGGTQFAIAENSNSSTGAPR